MLLPLLLPLALLDETAQDSHLFVEVLVKVEAEMLGQPQLAVVVIEALLAHAQHPRRLLQVHLFAQVARFRVAQVQRPPLSHQLDCLPHCPLSAPHVLALPTICLKLRAAAGVCLLLSLSKPHQNDGGLQEPAGEEPVLEGQLPERNKGIGIGVVERDERAGRSVCGEKWVQVDGLGGEVDGQVEDLRLHGLFPLEDEGPGDLLVRCLQSQHQVLNFSVRPPREILSTILKQHQQHPGYTPGIGPPKGINFFIILQIPQRCRMWLYNSLTIQRSMDPRTIAKLNQELSFFKSNNNFTLHFRPRELLDLYDSVAARGRPDLRRLAARIDKEMHAACGRSVYVALKWLGFYHKLLQETHLSVAIQVMERIAQSLARLPIVADKRHYEKYIQTKLLSPYKQYLLKLAQIQLKLALRGDSPRQGDLQSLYCMYNLVVFAMQQLAGAMRQFSRYFLRFYPCLNEYSAKVGKDLHRFTHRIRRSYQKGELPTVTFLQLEQLEGGLAAFDHHAQKFTNNWIFPQTNANSLELQAEEEERTQGNILQTIPATNNR